MLHEHDLIAAGIGLDNLSLGEATGANSAEQSRPTHIKLGFKVMPTAVPVPTAPEIQQRKRGRPVGSRNTYAAGGLLHHEQAVLLTTEWPKRLKAAAALQATLEAVKHHVPISTNAANEMRPPPQTEGAQIAADENAGPAIEAPSQLLLSPEGQRVQKRARVGRSAGEEKTKKEKRGTKPGYFRNQECYAAVVHVATKLIADMDSSATTKEQAEALATQLLKDPAMGNFKDYAFDAARLQLVCRSVSKNNSAEAAMEDRLPYIKEIYDKLSKQEVQP